METTENLGLRVPEESDLASVEDLNYNAEILDSEVSRRIASINGLSPDANGSVTLDEVVFARQIVTDEAMQSSGEYVFRTTGGDTSLTDGDATLVSVFGRRTHEGYTEESLTLTVNAAARQEGEPITATIDRDTFVAYVNDSATITLTYSDAWSANPSLYGVTVAGTPISGDQISIVYVKEDRGTITNATPETFVSTGWNLYNHANGYAHVAKYSYTYGFLIGGTYTGLQYSETLEGTRSAITVTGGSFDVPADGYVWVTGGNSTDTYILMTWSDWTEGYEGSFQTYTESEIDLTDAMENFPNGLMQVGGVSDEINLSANTATSRIERMAYSAANLETVIASGRAYECDANYIYVVRSSPIVYDIDIDGTFVAYDHGMEIVTGTDVAPYVQTIYGNNLVDYLRHDVPEALEDLKTLEINCGTISSLPTTINDTRIKSNMVCEPGGALLGTPSAQTGDWTVTTANGSITISGSISGSTTVTLYLNIKR